MVFGAGWLPAAASPKPAGIARFMAALNGTPSCFARALNRPAISSSSVKVVRMRQDIEALTPDVKTSRCPHTVIRPRTAPSSISARVPDSTIAPRSITA